MAEVKITKTQMFEAIKAVIEASEAPEKEDMVAFIDHQVELIANKAAKAKAKAATKKTEGDELRAAVEAVLTEEAQLIDDILAQIDMEGVTKAKVTARLTQLVGAHIAVKEEVKVEKSKRAAYRLATEAERAEVADAE